MAVIFSSSYVGAEETLWNELGIYGGQIYTIAVDPDDDDRIYAGSWNGDGFFISDDAGESWTSNSWFRNSAVYDIEIDPNDSDTIWVANDHEIDKSTDGGENWSSYTLPDGRFCYAVEVDPHDETGETVFVGTSPKIGESIGGTVFITFDAGATWEENLGLPAFDTNKILDIDFNPRNLDVWVTSNTFDVSNKSGIYVWTDEDSDSGSFEWWGWTLDYYMDEFLFHPNIDALMFVCGDGGVKKRQDDQSSLTAWDSSWSSEIKDYFARAICIPPQDTNRLYSAMSEDGVNMLAYGVNPWNSSDWYYANSINYVPDPTPDEFICLVADHDPEYSLYAGGVNEGIFRSTDEGKNWSGINDGILANSIYDSAVSPEDSSKVLFATVGGLFRNSSTVPLNDYSAYSVAYHPTDKDILYVGFSWGLSKSTNGGNSLSFFNPLSLVGAYSGEAYRVLSVAAAPDPQTPGSQTVYAGVSLDVSNTGYILTISDTGESFSSSYFTYGSSSTPVNCIAVHPADPEKVFIGMGSFYSPVTVGALNVKTSTASWTYVPMGSSDDDVVVNDIAIEQKSPYTMYAACGGSNMDYSGIYKSTDEGLTWVKKTGGLPDYYAVTDIKIDPNDSDFVYAAIYKGYDDCSDPNCDDMNGVYVSTNAGEYWSPLGLSDYYMYDVNLYNIGSVVSTRTRKEGRSFSYPQTTVVGGSASGGHSTSMSTGRGTIIGSVVDADDPQKPVTDAVIKTDTGSKCKTEATGNYMLFVPSGKHRVSFWSPTHVSENVPNVSVGTGEQITLDVDLKAGGSGPGDTTCILDTILGRSRSTELDPFRAFRDNVLGRTKYGRGLIDLYYRSGAEILKAVGKNPDLKRKSLGIIERSIPLFKSINEKERATFSTEFLNEVSALLFKLEKVVSPELSKTIYKIRLSIKRKDLFERLSEKKQRQLEPKDKTIGPEKSCRPKIQSEGFKGPSAVDD